MRTNAAKALIAAATPLATSPTSSQDYPNRPVRISVPFAPGGLSDILARLLGPRLSERLGQPVVVDNRPAASGVVGTEIVAKSASDGHTLLLAQTAHAVSAQLHAGLPYDPIKDFAPITMVISTPNGFFLHPAVPAKTVQEMIAYAKANPGKINYGSSGPGSGPHLFIEHFSSLTGIQMTHVPYKGAAQVVTALLSNEVQFTSVNLVSTMPHWKAGRLRLIAQGGMRRLETLPDVPTIAESGVPGYTAIGWQGFIAPGKTPQPIIDRLHKEIVAITSLPDVRQALIAQNGHVVVNTPAEFAKFISAEAEKWGSLGKRLGVRLD